MSDEAPKTSFSSIEEMMEYAKAADKPPEKKGGSRSKKSGKKKHKPAQKDPLPEATKRTSDVYFTAHWYLRPDENWQSVLKDAKDERAIRGMSVRIFVHFHDFTVEDCNSNCREVE